MFDYEVLCLIWWVLFGVLLVVFVIIDGFDMGVVVLLLVVVCIDGQWCQVINIVGLVWEGNQVWFILGGGVIFVVWLVLYVVSFFGFYLVMFLILLVLIICLVVFKFCFKCDDVFWWVWWDGVFCFSGVVLLLIFGVVVGNVL